nr:M23 family metallopeptidase [uncultured Flavobacterium sp.]
MKNYIIVFFLCYSFLYAQDYPRDFFIKPFDIDLNVTGSFGELRYNHFHSGIDLGTNRKIGIPVFAPADGEVVRIHINEKGYGKALYIKHPNGFTTVYGHLNSYGDFIEKYVKESQYKEKSYTIESFPLKGVLNVQKGQIIGYVGNTGSSAGPHLHYEIRDTQTEEILNPLLFGMNDWIVDTENPIINSLLVYPLNDEAVINGVDFPLILSFQKQREGVYMSQKLNAKGEIGFAVNAYDIMNNRYSKNGIYQIETFLNGSKIYQVVFDRFHFDETRNINVFIDYERLSLTKDRFQKLFKKFNYDLSLIKHEKNQGRISVQEGDSYNYKIVISDFHNNQTVINIPINYNAIPIEKSQMKNENLKKIDSKRDYIFQDKNATVEWNALTFYEDCDLDLRLEENQVFLHKDIIPLDKNISIEFDLTNTEIKPEKAFIALVNSGSTSYFYTRKNANVLSTRTRSLGNYKVLEDFDPPVIKPINVFENNKYTENDVLVFEVYDNLSGIKQIDGYINDQWVLFEYEYKDKQIKHQLKDGIATSGKNKLVLNVSDNVGNNSTFETSFNLN